MTAWRVLRRRVYRRDAGRCQVCLGKVGRLWDLGHLVDRAMGGGDLESNLVLMCVHCNRKKKPLHRTRAEALIWLLDQQDLARTGRELPEGERWLEFSRLLFGR